MQTINGMKVWRDFAPNDPQFQAVARAGGVVLYAKSPTVGTDIGICAVVPGLINDKRVASIEYLDWSVSGPVTAALLLAAQQWCEGEQLDLLTVGVEGTDQGIARLQALKAFGWQTETQRIIVSLTQYQEVDYGRDSSSIPAIKEVSEESPDGDHARPEHGHDDSAEVSGIGPQSDSKRAKGKRGRRAGSAPQVADTEGGGGEDSAKVRDFPLPRSFRDVPGKPGGESDG